MFFKSLQLQRLSKFQFRLEHVKYVANEVWSLLYLSALNIVTA
jgi:hypothetical protein